MLLFGYQLVVSKNVRRLQVTWLPDITAAETTQSTFIYLLPVSYQMVNTFNSKMFGGYHVTWL